MRKLELLAPAKNIEIGKAAIRHGADAVYIGPNKYGARQAAGNSIEEIKELIDYAHSFFAKVYITLNTCLFDHELEEARQLAWEAYRAGADALIIQDMGLLELDLPPIPLHASTQTDNRNPEKVRFLEEVGFEQVVLARELSLDQIREIKDKTNVMLEGFIHGALCVSYSGQCYISHALSGRSANRGACAQFCRLPYDLEDANGNSIVKNQHLLSLKDFNLTAHLKELIDAGISSFKIEGRLKDIDYVKNITAWYRQQLDAIISKNPDLERASSGISTLRFTPDPNKSFNRGFTTYFLEGRQKNIIQPLSPKSFGEPLGKVTDITPRSITIKTTIPLNNGDGLCFFSKAKGLVGFKADKIEGNNVFTSRIPEDLKRGTQLYRNHDHKFTNSLKGETAQRHISVNIILNETPQGFSLTAIDEDGIKVTSNFQCTKEEAQKAEMAENNLQKQLSKLGGTIFRSNQIQINWTKAYFIPAAQINEYRRYILDLLEKARHINYKVDRKKLSPNRVPFPQRNLSYLGNVLNKSARQFYKHHKVRNIQSGFEKNIETNQVPLMFTKHCIRYHLGFCKKEQTKQKAAGFPEPWFLVSPKGNRLELSFDCKKCEMEVKGQNIQ